MENRDRQTQALWTKLFPSHFSPAQRAHELAPAFCDLLPLPSLRFRHTRRRLSERCRRLERWYRRVSVRLLLPIGVVPGGGHRHEITRTLRAMGFVVRSRW
jgi:hypothetical protein